MNALEILILERDEFETFLYDLLVDPVVLDVPDNFWDPVPISLNISQIHDIPDIIETQECIICYENHLNFKKVRCCNNLICNSCAYEWFSSSVKCPYCKYDLRK